jgi:hypothetical protein
MNFDLDRWNQARTRGRVAIEARQVAQLRTFFDEVKNRTGSQQSVRFMEDHTSEEYRDRVILELLQNAHDAIERGGGRIRFVLTTARADSGAPAWLYVANTGNPFNYDNMESIASFALSSKSVEQGIGHKGIGFRSVFGVTHAPEIWSRETDAPNTPMGAPRSDRAVSTAFAFRFTRAVYDVVREIAQIAEDATSIDMLHDRLTEHPFRSVFDDWEAGAFARFRSERANSKQASLADEVDKRLSYRTLPTPADDEPPEHVLHLFEDGFATVVALPLMDAYCVLSLREQLDVIAGEQSLLFLERISRLEIVTPDDEILLERNETPDDLPAEVPDTTYQKIRLRSVARSTESDESRTDVRYHLWSRTLHLESQVFAPRRPEGWEALQTCTVRIAIPADGRLTDGRYYAFLPTDASTGCAVSISAEFKASLNRRTVDFVSPGRETESDRDRSYNGWLLQLAGKLAIDVLERMTDWDGTSNSLHDVWESHFHAILQPSNSLPNEYTRWRNVLVAALGEDPLVKLPFLRTSQGRKAVATTCLLPVQLEEAEEWDEIAGLVRGYSVALRGARFEDAKRLIMSWSALEEWPVPSPEAILAALAGWYERQRAYVGESAPDLTTLQRRYLRLLDGVVFPRAEGSHAYEDAMRNVAWLPTERGGALVETPAKGVALFLPPSNEMSHEPPSELSDIVRFVCRAWFHASTDARPTPGENHGRLVRWLRGLASEWARRRGWIQPFERNAFQTAIAEALCSEPKGVVPYGTVADTQWRALLEWAGREPQHDPVPGVRLPTVSGWCPWRDCYADASRSSRAELVLRICDEAEGLKRDKDDPWILEEEIAAQRGVRLLPDSSRFWPRPLDPRWQQGIRDGLVVQDAKWTIQGKMSQGAMRILSVTILDTATHAVVPAHGELGRRYAAWLCSHHLETIAAWTECGTFRKDPTLPPANQKSRNVDWKVTHVRNPLFVAAVVASRRLPVSDLLALLAQELSSPQVRLRFSSPQFLCDKEFAILSPFAFALASLPLCVVDSPRRLVAPNELYLAWATEDSHRDWSLLQRINVFRPQSVQPAGNLPTGCDQGWWVTQLEALGARPVPWYGPRVPTHGRGVWACELLDRIACLVEGACDETEPVPSFAVERICQQLWSFIHVDAIPARIVVRRRTSGGTYSYDVVERPSITKKPSRFAWGDETRIREHLIAAEFAIPVTTVDDAKRIASARNERHLCTSTAERRVTHVPSRPDEHPSGHQLGWFGAWLVALIYGRADVDARSPRFHWDKWASISTQSVIHLTEEIRFQGEEVCRVPRSVVMDDGRLYFQVDSTPAEWVTLLLREVAPDVSTKLADVRAVVSKFTWDSPPTLGAIRKELATTWEVPDVHVRSSIEAAWTDWSEHMGTLQSSVSAPPLPSDVTEVFDTGGTTTIPSATHHLLDRDTALRSGAAGPPTPGLDAAEEGRGGRDDRLVQPVARTPPRSTSRNGEGVHALPHSSTAGHRLRPPPIPTRPSAGQESGTDAKLHTWNEADGQSIQPENGAKVDARQVVRVAERIVVCSEPRREVNSGRRVHSFPIPDGGESHVTDAVRSTDRESPVQQPISAFRGGTPPLTLDEEGVGVAATDSSSSWNVGALGELIVYRELQRWLPSEEYSVYWVSRNATYPEFGAYENPPPVGASDDLGYDLLVTSGGRSWQLEVKSTRGDGRAAVLLGPTEVAAMRRAAASECNDCEWILVRVFNLPDESTYSSDETRSNVTIRFIRTLQLWMETSAMRVLEREHTAYSEVFDVSPSPTRDV